MRKRIVKMKTGEFDYHLPEHLIAQNPLEERDSSRLLVLDRQSGSILHRVFRDIEVILQKGDLLVFNNTKVMPARIFGRKPTGAVIEALVLGSEADGSIRAIVRHGRRLKSGDVISFEGGGIQLRYRGREGEIFFFENLGELSIYDLLEKYGKMPLPPYIVREANLSDRSRYQTIFAKEPGAVASPTAGLHFTEGVLERIKNNGVEVGEITLLVGYGTFKPVKFEDVREHRMHSELWKVEASFVRKLVEAKKRGRRVVAVGTTVVRTLESLAKTEVFRDYLEGSDKDEAVISGGFISGETSIFIYPGFRFQLTDALLTNFHLPKSTLIMLVSAFGGRENVLRAYGEAVEKGYRFFSYGDAFFVY